MQISRGKCARNGLSAHVAWLAAAILVPPAAVGAADVVVDCNAGGSINAALAPLDRQGPHTITVTGTCHENVRIIERERLTIQAPPGQTATIEGAVNTLPVVLVDRSRAVNMRRLALTGGGAGLRVFRSEVATADLTSENNAFNGMVAVADSHLELVSAVVRNNGATGVVAADGSLVGIFGATVIENNRASGVLIINNSSGPVVGNPALGGHRIQNNGDFGVILFHSSTIDLFNARVTGNAASGVRIAETSHAEMGSNTITGNGAQSTSFPGGLVVSENSDVFVGRSEISNNTGPGVLVTANATLSSTGGNTISGNTAEGVRLRRHAVGQSFAADDAMTNNGEADLACDTTSLAAGDLTGAARIRCAQIEREQGPPRPGQDRKSVV